LGSAIRKVVTRLHRTAPSLEGQPVATIEARLSKEHGIPIETVMASFGLTSAKGGSTDAKKEGTKDNVPPPNDEQRSGDAGGAGADD